jgi:predicted transposase/invertase (TIGR01784 family)
MDALKNELINFVREFPDRSIRWLLETPDNVKALLQIIANDLAKQIDYTKLKRIDRTFISDDFRKHEADIVFLAPFSGKIEETQKEIIIYILIEHQSKVDPEMAFRVLSYMVNIWQTQQREWFDDNAPLHQRKFRPILPVVFYTGNQYWESPLDMKNLVELPEELELYIPRNKILFLNLKNTEPSKLIDQNDPFGWILRVIQEEGSYIDDFDELLHIVAEHLNAVLSDKYDDWAKLIHFLFAIIYQRREQSEHDRLFNTIETAISDKKRREDVKKMGKTMAEVLIEEGIQKGMQRGIQKGIQKGELEGLHKAVSLGLEIKFGSDGIALAKKALRIKSIRRIEILIEAIRTAKSIEEIQKLI